LRVTLHDNLADEQPQRARHYVNKRNGVKDFDVWSFYAQYDDWPFPLGGAERRNSAPQSSADTPVIRRVTQAGV
jgi:hypothetical protein